MSFTLPNPTSPNTNDALTSAPIRQNLQAIASALNALDGGALNAKSVLEAALADAINPRLYRTQSGTGNFVVSGFVLTPSGSLTQTIPAGVAYVNGFYVNSAGGSVSLTASNDNYIDLDQNGNFHVTAVATNATSPALFANSIRIAICIAGSTSVSSVNQGATTAVLPIASSVAYAVTDSIGNLIYPTDPTPSLLGYRQIITGFNTSSTSVVQVTGLSSPVIVPLLGRKIRVTARTSQFSNTGANTNYLSVWDGTVGSGTQLDESQIQIVTASTGQFLEAKAVITPSAGLHTFNVGARVSGGSSTVFGSATAPATLTVEVL